MDAGERDRYSRQSIFPGIGAEGQARLGAAHVAIVGCGALGSYAAEALARAGIGRLTLIDRDVVEWSNLQRQWLFSEADAIAEAPKAIAAATRLLAVNREVRVQPHVSDLTPSNAEELLAGCDIILDGTDNFETRYLINDISVKWRTPWIYGAALGSYGVVMPSDPRRGPCFACVYPEAPSGPQGTCDVNGILSSATATVAAQQVALAMRLLTGWPDYRCFVQTFDVWHGTWRRMDVSQADPDCAVCGRSDFQHLEGQRRVPVSLCGRNAVQLHDAERPVDLQALAGQLRSLGPVRVNEFALRLQFAKFDVTVFPDGRAIVKGTTDVGVARSVYARLLGG